MFAMKKDCFLEWIFDPVRQLFLSRRFNDESYQTSNECPNYYRSLKNLFTVVKEWIVTDQHEVFDTYSRFSTIKNATFI